MDMMTHFNQQQQQQNLGFVQVRLSVYLCRTSPALRLL